MSDQEIESIIHKLEYVQRTFTIMRRYIAELEKQLEPGVIEEIKEELEHEALDQ